MSRSLNLPSNQEFEQIKQFIAQYELDGRNLKAEQFIAATQNNELVGFGRLKIHPDCIELCSLGVIIPERRKGIGKAITKKLISLTNKDIYLVCIIPKFFEPFGFKITNHYPKSIQEKLDYCTSDLPVPEKYVVMQLSR